MHPAALRTSCNSAMPGSEGFALVVTWLPFPIGNRSVRFWRRYLIRREIRAVCALVNDSASVVDGDAARRRAMAVFPRHHRPRLARCPDDDTLATTFALKVVLRVRHGAHGLTRARREL
jgi:hypothetical protein